MSINAQKVFAWCGVVFAGVFGLGMLLAGLLPPHSPSDTAAEIADQWNDNPDLQRFGVFLMMLAGGLTAPWGALISVYLKKIAPDGAYSNLQLLGAATGVVAILVPTFMFAALAFRPDQRPDDIMLIVSDLAWIPFVMNFPPALMQTMAVGFAALGDNSEDPYFPRWVGYYNLWMAFLFAGGGLVLFFKSGPFAWNGLIAFWLVAVVFGAWFVVMTFVLLRAIRKAEAEEAAAPAS
jgi:hypothetical protein